MERALAELVSGLARLGCQITVIGRSCECDVDHGVTFVRVPGPRRPFVIAYPWFLLVASLMVARRRRGVVQATGAIVLNRVDSIAIHYCHQAGMSTPSRESRLFRWHSQAAGVMKRVTESACLRLRRARVLVCVSSGVADEIATYYPRLASRVVTIPNGVDVESFRPYLRARDAASLRAQLGIPEGCLVAVFVGGEWQRKGLRSALEALAQAPMWTLVVAGTGDEGAYRALAHELNVAESVYWLGPVRDIPVVYELGDAFVLPSRYETFSLVTYEAAASGLPLLATPVHGVRDLLRDGGNGFFIDEGPASLAARLNQLGEDASRRMRMGEAARRDALRFGWIQMCESQFELFRTLARESSKGRAHVIAEDAI